MKYLNNSTCFAKITSYSLIYFMGVYPGNSVFANTLIPEDSQIQIQNISNIPIINIVTPNNSGVSHNTFKEFNVDAQGLVLNNSLDTTNSQLVGQIEKNYNFNENTAQVIINEVTGGNKSQLLGKLEVAGDTASVLISNPNGIICNGCGFINTYEGVIATGKPNFDKEGELQALEVTKGNIVIGEKGLYGREADSVSIISRALELNGNIQGKTIDITQGTNKINFKEGTIIGNIKSDSQKPKLAIDTKFLGGMYADKIRILATENGVGTNLVNLETTKEDISVSVNGSSNLKNITAKTDLNIGAKEINIESDSNVIAKNSIIFAGNVNNKGNVISNDDIRILGNEFINYNHAYLQANNNIWIQKNAGGDKSKEVLNKGVIKTNEGDLIIRSETITNGEDTLELNYNTLLKIDKPEVLTDVFLDINPQEDDNIYGYHTKLEHTEITSTLPKKIAEISSGKSAYLYGDNIVNNYAILSSENDLILTGQNFIDKGISTGVLQRFTDIDLKNSTAGRYIPKETDIVVWNPNYHIESNISAKNNLILDFKNKISLETKVPKELESFQNNSSDYIINYLSPIKRFNEHLFDTTKLEGVNAIKANNITILGGDVNIFNKKLESNKDISISSNKEANIRLANLNSGENISVISMGNISMPEANLKSKNIFLKSIEDNIELGISKLRSLYYKRVETNSLEASHDLTLSADNGNISLKNTSFSPLSYDISMFAKKDINIESIFDNLYPSWRSISNKVNNKYGSKYETIFDNLNPMSSLNSGGSILINSGNNITLTSVVLNASKNLNLNARNNIKTSPRLFDNSFNGTLPFEFLYIPKADHPKLHTQLSAGEDLLFTASNDIDLIGTKVLAGNLVYISTGNAIKLSSILFPLFENPWNQKRGLEGIFFTGIWGGDSNNYKNWNYAVRNDVPTTTNISSNNNITLIAGNNIVTEGSKISSRNNLNVFSNNDIKFKAVDNYSYISSNNQENVNKNVTELSSGGSLNISADGSVLFEATKLNAKGLNANWKPVLNSSEWGNIINPIKLKIENLQKNVKNLTEAKAKLEHFIPGETHSLNVSKLSLSVSETELRETTIELFIKKKIYDSARIYEPLKEGWVDRGDGKGYDDYAKDGPGFNPNIIKVFPKHYEMYGSQYEDYVAGRQKEIKMLKSEILDKENKIKLMLQDLEATNSKIKSTQLDLDKERDYLIKATENYEKLRSDIDFNNKMEATKNSINIAAKGGYLYAQALEEVNFYENSTWVKHSSNNKVSEFISSGDINILSRDDSTYEASKIEAGKNLNLTSTHGSINFIAVNNTEYERKFSTSSGFFIKTKDKGHKSNTWLLPQIQWGGDFVMDSANGIKSDIKVANRQTLEKSINILGNIPETAWIKELNNRNDVEWNKVKDAYDSWDKTKKSLHPMAGAIIAVAVSVVTAGAASPAAASVAAGSTAAQGALTAGMAALASKAAVSVIENEGNLSKVFKELGHSDSIKSIITSMAVGGALAGFDTAMGWDKAAAGSAINSQSMPLISTKDWLATTQRVVGQSVISSGLSSTINGGNFKDNFISALLSNSVSQLHAEGAYQIGNYASQLTEAGRAIGHAALSAALAEVSGGDGKSAAAGALAASMAASTLQNTFKDPKAIQAGGKIIGGLAGALLLGTAEGVNSGAHAGELTIVYNHNLHIVEGLDKTKENFKKYLEEFNNPKAVKPIEECVTEGTLCSAIIEYSPISTLRDLGNAKTAEDYLNLLAQASPVGKVITKGSSKVIKKMVETGNFKEATRIYNETLKDVSNVFKKNYKVRDLSKLSDSALNPDMLRKETKIFLKSSSQRSDSAVSYASASVTVNGKKEYYLSVSGKSWSGNSPDVVNIKGINYKIIKSDSNSIPNIPNAPGQTNFNHAEQKLFNHFQDTYRGKKADIDMAIQNTGNTPVGMCIGCDKTSKVFANNNKDFNINIYHGTTGTTGRKNKN
ncbi:DUF637 domain-containing protein [Xenorhabdus sp. DI]|uniref:DUF637 domain-containing protein n=1 Tax=Xenorhabdus doucetiae TaxID=351671 RepID=UPI0019A6245B|nr:MULTISPECIES: DUF637 domain-containing protein [unclassified Xenorhabdus]MBD2785085.1 DUF637 domain-containing protein [Xenorhabdus sp. 3]MBD2787548.1 DUF637 domain-containing protein [Xenorhabdus sp. DI]